MCMRPGSACGVANQGGYAGASCKQPCQAYNSRWQAADKLLLLPCAAISRPQFNQHVIIETNKTTERIFPAVPDVEHPEFFSKMDELVKLNNKVIEIGNSDMPAPLKALARAPYVERMIAGIFQIFIMKPIDCGSFDLEANQTQLSY